MTKTHEATVEALTAEVRVLMVGSRQITLSVARQLDRIDADAIQPFGRVRIDTGLDEGVVQVIGAGPDGVLARSGARAERHPCYASGHPTSPRCPEHRGGMHGKDHVWVTYKPSQSVYDEWSALPLIVLAGLR
jgi:hypothetical protein